MRYYKVIDSAGAVLYVGTGALGGVEITQAEYEQLKAAILARPPEEPDRDVDATEEDYLEALARLGVSE